MMPTKFQYAVIIPALNEVKSIENVINEIPEKFKKLVIVSDNGSTDGTADAAKNLGVAVAHAPIRGYGAACLKGIELALTFDPQVIIFLDADLSDYPQDMVKIVDHLEKNDLDLVIGSRNRGEAESGALLPQAKFGNWLATNLLWLRYGYRFTDLGPFRAIRTDALKRIQMQDMNFGWTVEMQIKALTHKLNVGEVSVRYRKRIGVSKITGTVKGTFMAGYKILWTIARYGFRAE